MSLRDEEPSQESPHHSRLTQVAFGVRRFKLMTFRAWSGRKISRTKDEHDQRRSRRLKAVRSRGMREVSVGTGPMFTFPSRSLRSLCEIFFLFWSREISKSDSRLTKRRRRSLWGQVQCLPFLRDLCDLCVKFSFLFWSGEISKATADSRADRPH
jgi:hypothetical protein